MSDFDLSGAVAIVTGGNGGIGLGIAEGLARAGADVAIAARNETKTTAAVARIEALGRRCLGLRCDVLDRADIARVVETVEAKLGRISILVNNAGVAAGGRPEALAEEVWDRVVDTNLKAGFLFAQACHPAMVRNGRGKVINIGSEYAIFGSPTVLPYSASKGGVVQMTKSLAVAWARDNIQVNCIIPGWITTDMTAGITRNEEAYRRIVERTPARRFGTPEECAGAAIFLASRASDFVTGQSICVDGGYSIA
ncbi:MAG TPA: glucose 1-dehydrogenase [Dehalococcoidia bacterium]|nr:glucose 1-dehydrogenase [Dehalococcoidia bacterium]